MEWFSFVRKKWSVISYYSHRMGVNDENKRSVMLYYSHRVVLIREKGVVSDITLLTQFTCSTVH